MRIPGLAGFFMVFFTLTGSAWAFDADQGKKTVSGKVTEVDWVKSMITVSYIDDAGAPDEIDIKVPSETRIMNGTEEESLSDIDQSDPVTVTYYDDGINGLKAISIYDLNQPNV
jgi:hypothetical protein